MSWFTHSLILLLAAHSCNAQATTAPAAVASQYSLATSTSYPFPTATLANPDTQNFLVSNWGLSKGKIQNGASNLAFVADPFPSGAVPGDTSPSTGPVLQVTYPAGSFSDNNAGGAQLYALWNASGAPFQSMLVSYEVAFDANYEWNKGGKLPGLRGGPNPNTCSGGNQANGTNCFSSRVMWRPNGAGEVYAYVPRPNNICKDSDVQCNDQFGVSFSRGSFSFLSGQWNKITMLVRLNSPTNIANGQITLYYNDVQALTHTDVDFRSVDAVTAGGLYFSTFFGGNDASWAPTKDTHTYFRNFQLYAGTAPSDLQGKTVKNSASANTQSALWVYIFGVGLSVSLLL
ncbi:polysaccharide lyase family 14 protein [Auriscalpium vulgare]|uniref:Polysaccharide lyase family 14 protein n=1 Tax=Auriscalpium vulgare TaxID=40419 RepID=A0ACB8S1V4_9AGAM|nr:polysaccharide lyase family 14 protein [Auriscalpium vulgare]